MIPFRTQRLATTVTNRILDLAENLKAPAPAAGAPAAPEPLVEGAELAAKIAAPKSEVDADPGTAAEIALSSLTTN